MSDHFSRLEPAENDPTPLVHNGGFSVATTIDKSLTTRLNNHLSITGESLNDISKQTQVSVLWLALVKNDSLASIDNKPTDFEKTKRLTEFLESQAEKNRRYIPRYLRP